MKLIFDRYRSVLGCALLPFFSLLLSGQPSELLLDPDPGSGFILHRTNYLLPEGNGAGQLWDMSQAYIQSSDAINTLSPVATPFGDEFGDADICYNYGGGDYIYTNTSRGYYERHGGVIAGQVLSLQNPAELFRLPLQLGDVHTDAFHGAYTIDGTALVRSGTSESEVVGQGTVIIDFSQLHEVHLVRCMERFTDAFEVGGEAFEIETERLSYFFVADDMDDILLSMVTQSQGAEDSLQYGVLYEGTGSQLSASLEQVALPFRNVNLSPNPTARNAYLKFSADEKGLLNMDILDLKGSLVLELAALKVETGPTETELDLRDLSPGTYLLRLNLNGRQRLMKLVKQ